MRTDGLAEVLHLDPEEDALDRLMYRRRGRAPRGSHRMQVLCEELGDPQRQLRSIHVVGTDGKTSTVRLIASLLHALGYRTGETTSPHLQDVTERIHVARRQVDREALLGDLDEVTPALFRAERRLGEPVSFFEAITGLALRRFVTDAVGAAVVEAGIGGAGDATNVLGAPVVVLSLIGHDHRELGETLEEVAAEKAGVVTPGATVVTAPQRPEVLAVLEEVVAQRGGRLLGAGRDLGVLTRRAIPGGQDVGLRGLDGSVVRGRLPLAGAHQAANAAVALAAVQAFTGTTDLDPARLRAGLAAVRVPGRVEVVRRGTMLPVVLDGAHDREAARALTRAVTEALAPRQVTVVLGTSGGRDPGPLLAELAPLAPRVVVTQATSPGARPVAELVREVRRAGLVATVSSDPQVALAAADRLTGPGGTVVVTGSLHLVGEVRSLLHAELAAATQAVTLPPAVPLVS